MSDFFTTTVIVATIASGIRLAVPFLLASLGEMVGQRSGVLNLGVEGVMLLGAFGGYYTVLKTDDVWLGLLVGIAVGLVMGVATAVMSVTLLADQGISGIGVYLFGVGMSDLLYQRWVGTPTSIPSFPKLEIPLLSDIPYVGDALFSHNPVVYLALLLVPGALYALNHTTWGANVRATGENPEAVDSLGVSVAAVRYSAVIIGGAMAGAAGAYLTIELGIFQQNFTNGQGFIAVALVYFGAWRPIGVLLGSLLYGTVAATVVQMNTLGIIPASASDLAAMTPALITVAALVLVARRFSQPTALTKPFQRGA